MLKRSLKGRIVGALMLPAAVFSSTFAPSQRVADHLPGTARLEPVENLPAIAVRQWDAYLLKEIERARAERQQYWQRDYSSAERYAASLEENRKRLERMVGVIDERLPVRDLDLVAKLDEPSLRAETAAYSVFAVRWPVFGGVHGEGLLLRPKGEPRACVVVIPDADQIPESLAGINSGLPPEAQIARRLAEQGALVLVPTLLDRRSLWSGDLRLEVYTDQPHREWIYRQAADVGQHPIGYEVQKVRSAIDWFLSPSGPARGRPKVGVVGYGEGGLLALFASAIDQRIQATWVSGYFQPRERLWQEPLYRNIWGYLAEFGDAELAAMVAPRGLVIEHSLFPEVVHPSPPDRPGKAIRKIAAPGRITTPEFGPVKSEWERARRLAGPFARNISLVTDGEAPLNFGSNEAMRSFSRQLGLSEQAPGDLPFLVQRSTTREAVDARQYRQVRELEAFTQEKIRLAEYERDDFFWSKLEPANPEDWQKATRPYRNHFWDKVIGRFPATNHPLNPRTRRLDEHSDERITTYEVLLDSRPGVYTWGYLLVPNDLQRGERRPVIVCQHGANGQPSQTLDPDGPYKAYARRLAERGFIVYAPYNPNKLMGEEFRQLQRKGNPINKTIFAVITANHQRTLQWLELQPFVDPSRIAFYGLSYGGKTAMRIPALLEKYCLSICSGDFNDHLRKVTLPRSDKHTLMFYDSYENVVFNMGNTFNYPEMAALIAPRPFMVEHGYKDRVAPLEWAAAEYSKVQKLYFYLGIPERTEMAFFDGPHMIHGEATFDFLHRQLNWKRKSD